MRRSPFLFGLIAATLLVVWAIALPATSAEEPTNVGLVHFDVIPLNSAARIEWTTATELGAAGFRIKRGAGNNFAYLDQIGFVAARGGPAIGAGYEVVDNTAVNGQTYTYKLIEVEANSREIELEAKTVTIGSTAASPTPVFIGGNPTTAPTSGPSSNTATATVAPTNTPTAVTIAPPTATIATPEAAISPTPTQATIAPVPTASQPPASAGGTSGSGATTGSVPSVQAGEPVEFLAQAQPTAENGYPAPVEEEPAPEDDGYPGGQPIATEESEPISPVLVTTPGATTENILPGDVSTIGSGSQVSDSAQTQITAAQATPQARDVVRGRGFLWGGFIVALLIFVTSVLGSVTLFTRRRVQ